MKNLTNVVFVVLTAVVLVSTIGVLTPRAVHAVAAQLVQNVDSPPRNAWSATCTFAPNPLDITYCAITLNPNYEYTIQTVILNASTAKTHTHAGLVLWLTTAGNLIGWVAPQAEPYIPGGPGCPGVNCYAISFPTTLYADGAALGGITAELLTDGNNPDNPLTGVVTLVGYSVNLAPAGS
jgi:hypothetical protein